MHYLFLLNKKIIKIKNCKFPIQIDVDVAPSGRIRENWNRFAHESDLYSDENNKAKDKRVFVIPVFEIKKAAVPKSQIIVILIVFRFHNQNLPFRTLIRVLCRPPTRANLCRYKTPFFARLLSLQNFIEMGKLWNSDLFDLKVNLMPFPKLMTEFLLQFYQLREII